MSAGPEGGREPATPPSGLHLLDELHARIDEIHHADDDTFGRFTLIDWVATVLFCIALPCLLYLSVLP